MRHDKMHVQRSRTSGNWEKIKGSRVLNRWEGIFVPVARNAVKTESSPSSWQIGLKLSAPIRINSHA